ncbi:regulator [Xenorhabdus sp. XENO-1]|uniref:regulator n=1 Tax=Xenorhabdus bovienii TaxID=40576 RepID=UPI0020CA4761|nr:regulator [Xenorhabdus bovienii]MCP9269704.1 regulator [Xenorhabdus bovienii subsp. africana]
MSDIYDDEMKKIDVMISLLRARKTDIKRLQKISGISFLNSTPKQVQKRNADADWIAMENIRRLHELHALAVELRFADYRDNYNEIELTDGWHRFKYKPREPFTKQNHC